MSRKAKVHGTAQKITTKGGGKQQTRDGGEMGGGGDGGGPKKKNMEINWTDSRTGSQARVSTLFFFALPTR